MCLDQKYLLYEDIHQILKRKKLTINFLKSFEMLIIVNIIIKYGLFFIYFIVIEKYNIYCNL